MTTHVMLDLETLGKGSHASILSIGAVKFDPFALLPENNILDTFYTTVDPRQASGIMDADTVLWWLMQSDEARRPLVEKINETKVGLVEALVGFNDWFGTESLPTWGNGATFDNVILSNAYGRENLTRPWEFWHDRCYRTLKSLAPSVKLERIGTFHHALDDAMCQAKHLCAIVRHLALEEI